MAISSANKLGKYVGICGQGPSDHADFAEWLMDEGIQTISLNPDTVPAVFHFGPGYNGARGGGP